MQIIKSIVRFVFGLYQRTVQMIRWTCQYRKIIKGFQAKDLPLLDTNNMKKVLVLAPHADDELIGCGSILMNKNIETSVLYYRLYGYDLSDENKKIRDREISVLSKKIGFKLFIGVGDIKTWLLEHLTKKEFDAVFIPSPYDWHWEHRGVFSSVVEVLGTITKSEMPELFIYTISVPQLSKVNTYVSELGKTGQKEKWELFCKHYVSQKMPVYRYKLQERINNNGIASELFKKVSSSEITGMYHHIADTQFVSELDNLKYWINDIGLIRTRVGSLLSKKE